MNYTNLYKSKELHKSIPEYSNVQLFRYISYSNFFIKLRVIIYAVIASLIFNKIPKLTTNNL